MDNDVNALVISLKIRNSSPDKAVDWARKVIVGGKYQVKFTGDWNAGMKTIDELVAKVRSERGMKAPSAKAKTASALPALKSKGAMIAKAANK